MTPLLIGRINNFQWSSQNERLAKLDTTVDEFWRQRSAQKNGKQERPISLKPNAADLGEKGIFRVVSLTHTAGGGFATIRCAVQGKAGVSAMTLWWKPLPSELSWQRLPMAQEMRPSGKSSWQATIPLDARGAMYLVETRNHAGEAENFPDETQETPYRVIPPFPATSK